MTKLRKILDEIHIGIISEASLSRLISKVKTTDFCIATAFRGNRTLKQNREINGQLLQDVNSQKMGGYQLIGHWQEAPDDVEFTDASPEQLTDIVEESVLFAKPESVERETFIEQCVSICKKYGQDAVIVGLVGDGVYLYFKDGTNSRIGSDISLNKTGQVYSQMRGKKNVPFIFEGMLQPDTVIGRQAFKAKSINYLKP